MKFKIAVLFFFSTFFFQAQESISIDSIINYASRTYISKPDSAQYYLHKGIQLAKMASEETEFSFTISKSIDQNYKISH